MKNNSTRILMSVWSQALILLLALVTGLLLPKILGSASYGFWALYLFYIGYVAIANFGYSDGITLINAGKNPREILSPEGRSGLWVSTVYTVVISLAALLILNFLPGIQPQQKIVFTLIIINIPFACLQNVVLGTYLALNDTKNYNLTNIAVRFVSTLFILILYIKNSTSFVQYIIADTVARIIVLSLSLWGIRAYAFNKKINIKEGVLDFFSKAKSGIKVTLAFIAASIMPLTGRVVLEHYGDMSLYGQYSFAMTMLTIIISFAAASGAVIFPIMRTLETDRFSGSYNKIIKIINMLVMVAFLLYAPISFIIREFLTGYTATLAYVSIILAVAYPLARIQLVQLPTLKTYRKENQLLVWNLVGVSLIYFISLIGYLQYQSPRLLAAITLIGVYIWMMYVEFKTCKLIGVKVDLKDELISVLFVLAFVASASFLPLWLFVICYGLLVAGRAYYERGFLIQVMKRWQG